MAMGMVLPLTICAQEPFAAIRAKVVADLRSGDNKDALNAAAGRAISALKADGSWGDINYEDSSVTQWKPAVHLDRVMQMAKAVTEPGSSLYAMPAVSSAIEKALHYWAARDPRSKNWWHNDIKTPQMTGEILLVLEAGNVVLPAALKDTLVQHMKRGNMYKEAGANKLDEALHVLYRACVTRDTVLLRNAVEQAFLPIAFTDKEGLQVDFSYLQHGPQLQLSSYGLVFLLNEYKMAYYLTGTPYALSGEKLTLLSRYFTHTFLPVIRGSYTDFNVEGRGVSRPGNLFKKKLAVNNTDYAVSTLFAMAKSVAGSSTGAIEAAQLRITQAAPAGFEVTPYHAAFWRADYTIHLRSTYTFNVRTNSLRTRRTETGNGENLLGKFMADGATDIQRRGDEYYNIMPVWNWNRIPGITSLDDGRDIPATVQWGEPGSTAFTGGVSDSLYGVSVYDMQYNGIAAHKAWFFGDAAVVCMGAGIRGNGDENIITTVNQCWLKGDVERSGKSATVPWVWHDSIAYFFPAGGDINTSSQLQKGSWKRINKSYSDNLVSGRVFSLWLNHGSKPAGADYTYVVVPRLVNTDAVKAFDLNAIQLLANTDSLQAVMQSGVLQAAFYKPGILRKAGWEVKVDAPCVLMIKKLPSGKLQIHIADPAQVLKTVHLTVLAPAVAGPLTADCHLPEGDFAGATLSLKL